MRTLKKIFILLFLLSFFVKTQAQEDKNNTQQKNGIRVTQAPLTAVKLVSVKNNLCNGDSKGAINISVSGGIPPYFYKWSNGAITQDIASIPAGTYKVLVYDSNKCKDSLTVVVNQSPQLLVSMDSIGNILCFGHKKGAVSISVKGGTAPYSYSWSNGATTQDISDVPASRYSVLVTDAFNCQEILSATVEQNPLIIRGIDDIKNIKCNGDSTGKIDITVSGGIPPYAYTWNNGAKTEDLSGLKAGKYFIVVTDANGCMEATNTNVAEPQKLSVKINQVKHVKCFGEKSGSINILVLGGVGPYSYKWNNGSVSKDLTGIPAGNYSVEIIDANGCKTSEKATVTEPEILSVSVDQLKNIAYHGGSDGSVNVKVAGGVFPYTYKWSNGAITKNISGLTAANYSLLVIDAVGCIKQLNLILTQPQPLILSLENIKHIKCNGDKNGAINIEVTGGVKPYTYKWSNGSNMADISEIVAGHYTVEVTDANGVKKTLDATIDQPLLFTVKLESFDNINCNGEYKGAVNISAIGGLAPYNYKWSNGANTQDLNGVPAGEYSAIVTDLNGCQRTISTKITEFPAIVLKVGDVKNILCNGDKVGSANISVVGGVAPYLFKWTNGSMQQNLTNVEAGNYSVTVTDAKGCFKTISTNITQPKLLVVENELVKNVSCHGGNNGAVNLNVTGGIMPYHYSWNNGVTTKNLANIGAGNYSGKVIDGNGCVHVLNALVTEPPLLTTSMDGVTNIMCHGDSKGAINISVTGGVTPYTYKWSNGLAMQDLTDAKAGSYSVLITDANGCKDTINSKIVQNPLLVPFVEAEKNIKCNGDRKGAVSISVKGGVAPYNYKWSNGTFTQNIVDVQAGSYSVTVTDAVGCMKTIHSTITEPSLFTVSLDETKDVKCFGDSTGSINIQVKGGVIPYVFSWSNGEKTEDINNLKAGAYNVKVTDANGCTGSVSATISQPPSMVCSLESVSNLLCNGNSAGMVNISVLGGTVPYNYAWSNGAKAQDLTGLAAGKYSVKITDANGCMRSLSASITEPPALNVSIDAIKQLNCYGEKKGGVNVSVKGGVPVYAYSWSNGVIAEDLVDVPAGNYTFRVVDANGCIKSIGAEIAQPAMLHVALDELKNIVCYGDTSGAISISVKGGSVPYSYKWSNGQNTEDIKGVIAGTYTVSIKDAKGCTENLTTTILQPAQLIQSLDAVQNVGCHGNKSGMVNITVTGGSSPYIYKWNNGAITQDLTEVPAGSYSVMVSDANGCKGKTITATVKEPEILTSKVDGVKDIARYGEKNGGINISVAGGVFPYKYSWSNGAIVQNLLNVSAGNYTCMVTDAKGCMVTVNASISEPQSLVAEITSIKEIKCYGEKTGAVDILVSGGSAPYKFSWSNGETSEDLTNVPAGIYSVVITDGIGHKQLLKTTINQPQTFALKINSVKNLTCYENNTGAIVTSVTGGVPPYSFKWNNGSTTQDLSGIGAGAYSITITDKNGCQSMENVTINQPTNLNASVAEVKHLNCKEDNKGAINIEVNGGVPPYQYSWSNGAKSHNITGVSAGNYSVRIADANGCVRTIAETLTQPDKLTAMVSSINSNNCFADKKGSISLSVIGGVSPYAFKWSNGDTIQNLQNLAAGKYSVVINDSKGCQQRIEAAIEQPTLLSVTLDDVKDIKCNGESTGSVNISVKGGVTPYLFIWSNGGVSEDISSLGIGDYAVTVSDSKGCSNNTIKASITQPTKLAVKVDTAINISCNGNRQGAVNISTSGGVLPYLYNWSNGAITEDLSSVPAGSYSVRVKDNNGCMDNITVAVSEPSLLIASIDSVRNLKCYDDNIGAINITVKGGQEPYNFQWNNGNTSQNLKGVAGGKYSVNITDAMGCKQSLSATITQPPMLIKTLDAISNLHCNGDNSGLIHLTVAEGVMPYTYQWSNGANTQDLIGVPAGEYSVSIKQGNGCINVLSATITEPSLFVSKIEKVTNIMCNGNKKGAIELSVSGGIPPYNYQWNNGAKTQNLYDLGAESYSAMITDANGCLNTVNVNIAEPALLTLNIDSLWYVKCCGDSSGAVFITAAGGVGPYKYLWSNGKTTEDIKNLKQGQYSVIVTDANGCTISTPKDGMTLYDQIMSQGKFITRNILFDIGKSIIKVESFMEIMKIATLMKDHPDLMFSIEGHTDSDGDAVSNRVLSENRARAIKEALIKMGIDNYRLESKGWGKDKPIDTNSTSDGKSNNRRVEFILITPSISSSK